MEFKSYYVVWKPKLNQHHLKSRIRLNRTMQYGNTGSFSKITDTNKSLNRTMQYGNSEDVIMYANDIPSLNRTMQYGNNLIGNKLDCYNNV